MADIRPVVTKLFMLQIGDASDDSDDATPLRIKIPGLKRKLPQSEDEVSSCKTGLPVGRLLSTQNSDIAESNPSPHKVPRAMEATGVKTALSVDKVSKLSLVRPLFNESSGKAKGPNATPRETTFSSSGLSGLPLFRWRLTSTIKDQCVFLVQKISRSGQIYFDFKDGRKEKF